MKLFKNLANWIVYLITYPIIWIDEKVNGTTYARATAVKSTDGNYARLISDVPEGYLHITPAPLTEEEKLRLLTFEDKIVGDEPHEQIIPHNLEQPSNEPIYNGGVVPKEELEELSEPETNAQYIPDHIRLENGRYVGNRPKYDKDGYPSDIRNDEPKQDLLVICLENIDSVPEVYYKGEKIKDKRHVDFSWSARTSIIYSPTAHINIVCKDKESKYPNDITIRHNEMGEDTELQEKYDELKEKYDKLLEGMAGYMLGDTHELDDDDYEIPSEITVRQYAHNPFKNKAGDE